MGLFGWVHILVSTGQIRLVRTRVAPPYLPHTALHRCRGAAGVPVGTTNTQAGQRCTLWRAQVMKAEGSAWLRVSMSGSICNAKLTAASRRTGSILTCALRRHSEALTQVCHARNKWSNQPRAALRVTAIGEGEMANNVLPWRRLLLTAWTWPLVLTISPDVRAPSEAI